jgi:hypothetical protein
MYHKKHFPLHIHIRLLKIWWQYATLFVYFSYFITYIQSSNHIHTIHSPNPLPISSSLVSSVGKTSLWCRAENRTRACLSASRRTTKSRILCYGIQEILYMYNKNFFSTYDFSLHIHWCGSRNFQNNNALVK